MDNMKHRRLQELDRSDFEIVKGEPDIRGWDVKTKGGEKIGSVEELILDAQEKQVRYMVVDMKDNELELDHRKVLIPIGLAELDEHDDDVLIPRITWEQLEDLPDYDRNTLTHDVERNIRSILDRKTRSTVEDEKKYQPQEISGSANENLRSEELKEERKEEKKENEKEKVDPDFYRHEYYNLDNLYKNRLHEAEPVNKKKESEYEKGFKLWEKRSEGGILPGETTNDAAGYPKRESNEEIDEEARMEMVKNRRANYQQRRYSDEERPNNRDENRRDDY